jgi:anti-sigma B factor antagonist
MGDQPAGLDLAVENGTAIVRAWGVLDLTGSSAIRPLMDAAIHRSVTHYLFDLDGVSFLDGSGLQELMRFREAAREQGKRVSIVNGHPRVRRLFSVLGSSRVLDA